MKLNVYLDGQFFTTVETPDDLEQIAEIAGVDAAHLSIPVDERTAFEAFQKRMKIRAQITPLAGDTQSLLGTTADAVGLLIECIGKLAGALAVDGDVQTVAQTIVDDFAPIMNGLDDGSVKLPHRVKSVPSVITEIAVKGTAVASVFEDSSGGA